MALPPLRISAFVTLLLLSVGGFLLSAWGETHFHAGPQGDRTLVEYVLSNTVEFSTDATLDEWQPLDSGVLLAPGLAFRTDVASELGLFFNESDLVRLFPNTEVVVEAVNLSRYPVHLELRLVSGSLWMSTLQGVLEVEVTTDRIRSIPENASAFVDYSSSASSAKIFAAHHPVRVFFIDNDYLLTESHQVLINTQTLNSIVNPLRYTKLTKEYPFTYIASQDWESSWSVALKADLDRRAEFKSDFVAFLRREGDPGYEPGTLSYSLHQFYKEIRSYFTLDKAYLQDIHQREELELFYQGLYLIAQGQSSMSVARFQAFRDSQTYFESFEALNPLAHFFQSVLWGDDFYPAKEAFRSFRENSASTEERFGLILKHLRDRLNEIYDLVDLGEMAAAQEALLEYNAAWSSFMNAKTTALADWVQVLTEERQILQNLLYREDVFYRVESYEVLSQLEENVLTLTSEETNLNEERQSFIQDKLRVLNRLIRLIDENEVSIEEGSALAYRLISESQALLQEITVETAVVEYYFSQLAEMTLKYQFINSSDYPLEQGTFEQKFESYLQKEQDLSQLTDYIRGLTQEDSEEPSITLDEALEEVRNSFKREGVYYIDFLALGDTDYRLFKIEGGRIDRFDIEGNYDRVTGIVYDLHIEGENFSAGVKLDSLVEAVNDFMAVQESSDEEVDEESSSQSSAADSLSSVEALAIDIALETLESEGQLVVFEEDISIDDLEENTFKVNTSLDYQGEQLSVEFYYDEDTHLAYDIMAEDQGKFFTVEDVQIVDFKKTALEAWLDE